MQIICRSRVAGFPVLTETPLPVYDPGSVSTVVYDGEVEFQKTVSASGYNDWQLALDSQGFVDGDYELVNDTPEIASLSGDLVLTRLTDGIARLRIVSTTGLNAYRNLFYNMTHGAITSYLWTGYNGTSNASVMTNAILDLLIEGKAKAYYTDYAAWGTAVRNPDCWAAGLDLSGSAYATDVFRPTWSSANSGALITPRHMVGVRHWLCGRLENMGPGRKYRFEDGSERTVVARYQVPNSDLQICLLDSDVTAAITPFPIAGPWFIREVANGRRMIGSGFSIDQWKQIHPVHFDTFRMGPNLAITTGHQIVGWKLRPSANNELSPFAGKEAFFGGGVVGDSGGAICGISQGQPFVVSLFSCSGCGDLIGPEDLMNSYIGFVDDLAGISTGYTVTVAPEPTAP